MAFIPAAIGSLFTAGGAAAGVGAGAAATAGAAGIFSGGGALGLLGGIATGVGSAMMAREERREMERSRIAEEQRRQATYAGAGDAVAFWENAEDSEGTLNQQQRVNAQSNTHLPVGQRETRTLPGQQYRLPAPQTPKAPSYSYNQQTRRIERA